MSEFTTPAGAMRRNGKPEMFPAVKVGHLFECNGNVWRKKSTRTAVMHWPAGPERAFYFRNLDIVFAERAP